MTYFSAIFLGLIQGIADVKDLTDLANGWLNPKARVH